MSTLLQKPLKAFAAYALLILVCSVPVYYWVVNTIWLEELDEHNALIAYRIEQEIGDKNIDEAKLAERIRNWRQVLGDLTLEPVTAIKADSVYTGYRRVAPAVQVIGVRCRASHRWIIWVKRPWPKPRK